MLYFLKNLRNEEQVAVIQAGTVISLCEKVSGKFLCYILLLLTHCGQTLL